MICKNIFNYFLGISKSIYHLQKLNINATEPNTTPIIKVNGQNKENAVYASALLSQSSGHLSSTDMESKSKPNLFPKNLRIVSVKINPIMYIPTNVYHILLSCMFNSYSHTILR